MAITLLGDRGLVRVEGADSCAFLDGLLTCDLGRVAAGRPRFGALLSPQGKILFDFHVWQAGQGAYHLDVARAAAPDLVKRLGFYRLRAKIAIADVSDALAVLAGWGDAGRPADAADDPRLADLGWRAIIPRAEAERIAADDTAYHGRRIRLGVPESGRDFAPGEAFPHEALMDQLGGVDFDKGCYVGQEVVSRMQHRGTARSRFVQATYPEGTAAPSGTEVTAGARTIGRTGSADGDAGLALLRLDRLAEAQAAGEVLRAGGAPLRATLPGWVRFALPKPSPASPDHG